MLEVEVQRPQRRRYTDQTVAGPVMSRPMVRFLLGDDSGARSQLTLPFNRRCGTWLLDTRCAANWLGGNRAASKLVQWSCG